MRVLHRELALLDQALDLVVLAEEDRLHAFLPRDPDLFSERVVVTSCSPEPTQRRVGASAECRPIESLGSYFVRIIVAEHLHECFSLLSAFRGGKEAMKSGLQIAAAGSGRLLLSVGVSAL